MDYRSRNVLTIPEAIKRSKDEGIPIAEVALRRWVKEGKLPVAYAGRKALIYWPNLVNLVCCGAPHSEEQAEAV